MLDRIRGIAGGIAQPQVAPAADVMVLIAEGNALEDEGRPRDALQRYDAAVSVDPGHARAHLNRGNALLALNDASGATDAYERAVALDPGLAGAHFNLGNALMRSGRFDAAMAAYRKAIALRPDFADAEVALGVAQEELGHVDDAVASYRRALGINPAYTEVHCNLGNALKKTRRLDEAIASYRQAIATNPDYADAHRGLGDAWQLLGRPHDAVASFRHALSIDPNLAGAHNDLGNVLQQLGLLEDALRSYRSALAIDPNLVEAHSNSGNVLLRLGRFREAVACQRRALEIKPDFAEAHSNLAHALRDGGWPVEAIASYGRAIAINAGFAHAHIGLGDVLKDVGRLGDAARSYRRALEIDPAFHEAHTSLLFCLSHDESVDPKALFAEHRNFADRFEAPLRTGWPVHGNVRDPARCLSIGFVSGDFRTHAVAYFIEPLLGHLAEFRTLSLHAYSNHAADDDVTKRLRRHFKHWRSVADLSDAALADQIGQDRIDVLIDLSGHTARNRLCTFALKPAPIQASWMGYPGTTGLAAMDYYFADAHFLPFDEFGDQFTEKLVHLPAAAPFLPEADAPPVNALPALSSGCLTFGSFNRPSKLGRSVVALWSRLLRALPEARMILGAMPQDGQFGQLLEWFAAEGIARDRLEFQMRCDTATYLARHHRVDLCLDAFPYAGGTTTAHALWMGVPTLSLAGRTPASRHGATLLAHVGLDEFVARTPDDFVRRGVELASNLDELAELRARLRARCGAAAFSKPDEIAVALERALRMMWKHWCAGLPAEAFSVAIGDDR